MKTIGLLFLLAASSSASAYTITEYTPTKWGDPTLGTGATISYSFMLGGESCDTSTCSALDSFMSTGYKLEIERAFDTWSSVANLNFFEVPDDGLPSGSITNSGDIRIGGEDIDGPENILAHAFYPHSSSWGGDIHFDSSETWTVGPSFDSFDIFFVALHEIGHSLGLGHSSFADAIMGPYYNPSLTTLSDDDIAGIQYLYGQPILSAVPLPATLWLLTPTLMGFIALRKRSSLVA